MQIRFCPLYSGSSGNALFVQYGETRLLIDAGKSGRMITEALAFIGEDIKAIDAILVTHEHTDHVAGVGVLARRYHMPVYATGGTWRGMGWKVGDIPAAQQRVFEADADFYIGRLGISAFSIPHDAAEPVGFRFWGGDRSISTATDLGYFPKDVLNRIGGSDLVLLESNHDPDMLIANDHYSPALKKRILGRRGHLSNDACAEAAVQLRETGVRNLILGHLSGENNTPRLALTTTESRCELEGMALGTDICIDVAYRDRVGAVYAVGE